MHDSCQDGNCAGNIRYAQRETGQEAALLAANHKPFEELYDLKNDPHEVGNLAHDELHVSALRDLRAKLAMMENSPDVPGINAGMAEAAGITPLE